MVRAPILSLDNVEYVDVAIVGLTMETELQIENPNSFTIVIPYVNYNLYLNDVKCGRGTSSKRLKIKAYSVRELEVPVKLTFLEVAGSVGRALHGKSGSYRIEGEVVISTSAGDRSFPFENEGRTDFTRSAGAE